MKKIAVFLVSIASYLTQAAKTDATAGGGDPCADPSNPLSFNCIPGVIQYLINGALIFAGTVAMFFIVFAGAKYILSGGDPKQVEGAKKTLTYAIIGLIVVLSAFFIINLLSYITGVESLKFFDIRVN